MTKVQNQTTASACFQLKSALEYAPGSVATRHLIQTPGGQITLFAFDSGQGLTPHTAPCDALVQVLEGEIEFTLNGEPLRMKCGDCVRMTTGAPHSLQAKTPAKMMLTLLRG